MNLIEFIEVARYHAHPTSNNSIKIYLLQLSVYDRSPVFLGDRKLNVGKFWETPQPLWAWAQSSQLQVQSVVVNISYPFIRIIIFQSPSMLITRSFGSSGLVGSKLPSIVSSRCWVFVTVWTAAYMTCKSDMHSSLIISVNTCEDPPCTHFVACCRMDPKPCFLACAGLVCLTTCPCDNCAAVSAA